MKSKEPKRIFRFDLCLGHIRWPVALRQVEISRFMYYYTNHLHVAGTKIIKTPDFDSP